MVAASLFVIGVLFIAIEYSGCSRHSTVTIRRDGTIVSTLINIENYRPMSVLSTIYQTVNLSKFPARYTSIIVDMLTWNNISIKSMHNSSIKYRVYVSTYVT